MKTKAKKEKKVSLYKGLNKKEKAKMKPTYEMVFLLRQDMSSHDVQDFCKGVASTITSKSGSIIGSEYWGLRQLAYKINKNSKSHYYLMRFYGNQAIKTELDRIFKISDRIVRYIILRIRESATYPISPLATSMQKDIEDGVVIFDQNYVLKIAPTTDSAQ